MSINQPPVIANYEPWPALPYQEFAATAHLLHMSLQVIGKLRLTAPFQPHWDHVSLLMTATGLTTGPIPYRDSEFMVDIDFINHQLRCKTAWGQEDGFALATRSVAEFTALFFATLKKVGIEITINTRPQEVANPIPFEQDTQQRPYDATLVNAWWRILLSSRQVMERYHARFLGRTPEIGFMWGTFDLRDVRYNGKPINNDSNQMGFITRNAMDAEMVEVGWWPGDATYPRPTYFSFTYPHPAGIENARIQPDNARWSPEKKEFILHYDDIRNNKNPDDDLLAFFETTYQAGAELGHWDPKLIGPGKPV